MRCPALKQERGGKCGPFLMNCALGSGRICRGFSVFPRGMGRAGYLRLSAHETLPSAVKTAFFAGGCGPAEAGPLTTPASGAGGEPRSETFAPRANQRGRHLPPSLVIACQAFIDLFGEFFHPVHGLFEFVDPTLETDDCYPLPNSRLIGLRGYLAEGRVGPVGTWSRVDRVVQQVGPLCTELEL